MWATSGQTTSRPPRPRSRAGSPRRASRAGRRPRRRQNVGQRISAQPVGRGRCELVLRARLLVPFGQLERVALHPPDERPDLGIHGVGRSRLGPSTQARRFTSTGRVEIAPVERLDLVVPDRPQASVALAEERAAGRGQHERRDRLGRARAASTAIPAPIDVPTRWARRDPAARRSAPSRSACCDHGPVGGEALAVASRAS